MISSHSYKSKQSLVPFCCCCEPDVLPVLRVFRAHRGDLLYTLQEAAGQFSVLDLRDWSKTLYAYAGIVSEVDVRVHIEATFRRPAERIGERSWAA